MAKVNLTLRVADAGLVVTAVGLLVLLVPWRSHIAGVLPELVLYGSVFALVVVLAATIFSRRAIGVQLANAAAAHAALQDSEARFRGILAIAADAIITIDEAQCIVDFNHAAERMFGYEATEITGHPVDLLMPSSNSDAHRQHVQRFARSPESSLRMEERRTVTGRRRNGEVFPVDISLSKLQTSQGMIFTAVIRDATVRRQIEHHDHTLAVAGARLATTLDYDALLRVIVGVGAHAVNGYCILDVAEPGEAGSTVLRRLASRHDDPDRERALRSIEDRGLHWDSPSEAIDVFRTGVEVMYEHLSPDWLEAHSADASDLADGTTLAMRGLLAVPLKARNQVIGVLTVGSCERALDPADLELARAVANRAALAIENALLYGRAQRALASRDEILAIVSHDLRTPASTIAMCARILLEHPPESEGERRSLYGTIQEASNWMHRLMQDLLDTAAIDAGRLSVHLLPAPIGPIIQATADQFTEPARAAAVTLRIAIPADLPDLMIDADRIVQMLGNLLSNAIRFTPAGGTITIAAGRAADGVELTVRDSGRGIVADDLPHLFDRFWQARRAGAAPGAGLGLAIAKGIVEAHRGRIAVESEVGRGSAFSVLLPFA